MVYLIFNQFLNLVSVLFCKTVSVLKLTFLIIIILSIENNIQF